MLIGVLLCRLVPISFKTLLGLLVDGKGSMYLIVCGSPKIVNNDATATKEVDLEDPVFIGARFVKQVVARIIDLAGGG